MLVTMDRYTRYYLIQSGGGEIGPVCRASFRMQWGNGVGSFFRCLFRFVKPLLYSGSKVFGKEALKTGFDISNILNKEPENHVSAILKNCFNKAKGNLEEMIKMMTGSGLALKRKRKTKKPVSWQT